MSFSKDFRTGGSTRATLRLEMINVTNTPWFVGFSTAQSQFGSSSFGQFTSQANYSRLTQVSFRFQRQRTRHLPHADLRRRTALRPRRYKHAGRRDQREDHSGI